MIKYAINPCHPTYRGCQEAYSSNDVHDISTYYHDGSRDDRSTLLLYSIMYNIYIYIYIIYIFISMHI